MYIELRRFTGDPHLWVDPASAAELGGSGNKPPPELGCEDALDLLQLRQVPAPCGGVHEPRCGLPQLLGALPVRVDERRPLDDEAAVGLELGEHVERVLLPDDVLGARQRAVGVAQVEQLLDVPARLRAPHLPVAAHHAQPRHRQPQQRPQPRRLLRRPPQQHVQPPPHRRPPPPPQERRAKLEQPPAPLLPPARSIELVCACEDRAVSPSPRCFIPPGASASARCGSVGRKLRGSNQMGRIRGWRYASLWRWDWVCFVAKASERARDGF